MSPPKDLTEKEKEFIKFINIIVSYYFSDDKKFVDLENGEIDDFVNFLNENEILKLILLKKNEEKWNKMSDYDKAHILNDRQRYINDIIKNEWEKMSSDNIIKNEGKEKELINYYEKKLNIKIVNDYNDYNIKDTINNKIESKDMNALLIKRLHGILQQKDKKLMIEEIKKILKKYKKTGDGKSRKRKVSQKRNLKKSKLKKSKLKKRSKSKRKLKKSKY